jgi:glutamate dehydrogenase
VFRAIEESGASAADIIRAYVVVREVFGLRDVWAAVEALDNQVPTSAQTMIYLETRRLLDRAVRWLVSSRRSPLDVPSEIDRLRAGIADLMPKLESLFRGTERETLHAHATGLASRGLPAPLAERTTRLVYGFGLLDVVEVANKTGHPLERVAEVYFVLSEKFRVDELLSKISLLPREDRWQTLARMALRYDLYAALAALTAEVLNSTPTDLPAPQRVRAWEEANASSITRTRNALGEFGDSRADLAALSVLLRQIRTLVRTASAA